MKRLFTSVGALSLAALLTFGCASPTVEEADTEFGSNTVSGSVGLVAPEFGTNTTSGSIGQVAPEFGTNTTSGSVGRFDGVTITLPGKPVDVPPSGDWVLPEDYSATN